MDGWPKILKTKKSKTKFVATGATLPLGVLAHQFDSTTAKYGPDLNHNLHLLFSEFAFYMKVSATGELYDDVFEKWILNFLKKSSSNQPIANGAAYELDNIAGPAQLISRFDTHRVSAGRDVVFMYIGLYLFVIWYLAVRTATGTPAVLMPDIMHYVTEQLRTLRLGSVKIAKQFFTDGHDNYTPEYLRAFEVKRSLGLLGITQSLGNVWNNVDGLPVLAAANSPDNNKKRNQLTYAAVQLFKETIALIATEELKRLLWFIDDKAFAAFGELTLLTIGNGSGTNGFFGKTDLGIIFFDYEMRPDPSYAGSPTSFPQYLGIQAKRDVNIWCSNELSRDPPSVFTAYCGFNGGVASLAFDADTLAGDRIGTKKLTIAGNAFVGKNYFPEVSGESTAFQHDGRGNVITKSRQTGEINMKADSGGDEVMFLLFEHRLFGFSPDPPEVPNLFISQKFLNNRFGIPTTVWQTYWSTAEEEDKLDQIIHALKNNPGAPFMATCRGQGIGREIESKEVGKGGPAIQPAPDRADNRITDALANPKNEPLRYSYGEIRWHNEFGGQQNVVEFVANGFVSPLRCTWATWSFFQGISPKTGLKKANTLHNDIGKHLRDSLGKGPSYNTALSAFRAFAVIEAMILKLKNRIASLTLANSPPAKKLTNQEGIDLTTRLDTFLDSIQFPVSQIGSLEDTDVIVNYDLFHKYAD